MGDVDEDTREVSEWFLQLIAAFREKTSKLSREERSKIASLDDLSAPCQVNVIWLSNPAFRLDEQLAVITHFKDEDDLTVRVYGPILPWKALESFEKILIDDRWKKELPKAPYLLSEGERAYNVILDGLLVQAYESFKNRAMQQALKEAALPAAKYRAQLISNEASSWCISGNVTQLNPHDIVSSVLNNARTKVASEPQIETPKLTRIKCSATFFYPPIWIGEVPKKTLKDKLDGVRQPAFRTSRRVIDTEYKGYKVVINNDGFIAIATEDKKEALEKLNEIMVSALLSGVPSLAVRESEIGEAEIDTDTNEICGHRTTLISMRTRLMEEQWQITPTLIPLRRKLLDPLAVIQFIKLAETLTADTSTRNILKCLLEATTHFSNSEYAQCIVMGWVVIETVLENQWQGFLRQKGVTGKRKDKLTDLRWTIDMITETLSLAGLITPELYERVLKVKTKRNHIVHDGDRAIDSEARECIDLALTFLAESQNQKG